MFPAWTGIFALISAMLVAPIGYGLGAAVGHTLTRHDMMVGVLDNLSVITKRVMEATVGQTGHGMAREITQVVMGHINEYGLGKLCQAASMTGGAAAGAAVGAAKSTSLA